MVRSCFLGSLRSGDRQSCVKHSSVSKHPHTEGKWHMHKKRSLFFLNKHEKTIAVTWANLQSSQIFSFWGSVCSAQAELSKAMISVKVNNLTYHTWANTMEQVLEKYGCISNVYILQGHFTRVLWLCLHPLPQVPYHHGCPSWDRAGWPQTVDTDGTHQLPTRFLSWPLLPESSSPQARMPEPKT